MPELPEVETVKRTLKEKILNKTIIDINIYYENIIEYPTSKEFKEKIINQKINDIKRKGKILMFELDDYFLLSHLRMEGRFFLRNKGDEKLKHEHITIILDDEVELKYIDTRKFGKMYLIKKDEVFNVKPLCDLGLEPCDLTINYLKENYKNRRLPIKTMLLDQKIIAGIGNIYADEILFLSKINPLKKVNELNELELESIIKYTRDILKRAIEYGGTTIDTYESSEGVHGNFQNELQVHRKEKEHCSKCNELIVKIKVGGRGTYYCPKCQK